jgi:RNA polymerase sigma factor (sigma-70 family)
LGNREEAEDATQSTFLNAFRGFRRGVDPEFESAWLYKIAQNVCLTRQRSSSRRRKVETPGDLDAMQDYVPAHQADSDELIRLPEALDAMPEQQRRALLLREWQGLSYKEIGEELDLSQAAVETLLFRARRTLAAGLGEEPVKKAGIAKRLGGAGDFGSILSIVKSLVLTGGVKVATAVATVAATSVVAATPATRQAVEDVVSPRHDPAPVHQVSAKAAQAGGAAAPVHAPSALVPARPAAASALRTAPPPDVASTIKRLRLALHVPNSSGTGGLVGGHDAKANEALAAVPAAPVPALNVEAPVPLPVQATPAPAPAVAPQPAAPQPAVTQPAAPVTEKPKADSGSKGNAGGRGDAVKQALTAKKDDSNAGQGTSNRANGNSGKGEQKHDGGSAPATAVTPATGATPTREPAAVAAPAAPSDGGSSAGQGAAKSADSGRWNKAENNNKSSHGKGDNKTTANVLVVPAPAAPAVATTTTAAPAVAPPTTTTTTPATTTTITTAAPQPSAPQAAQSTKNNQGHSSDGKVDNTDKGGHGKRK